MYMINPDASNTRRMISKYPFVYEKMNADQFFKKEKGAIYLHFPFCVRRCHYCTYVTKTGSTDTERERYVRALIADIKQYNKYQCLPEYEIESIYFGGGTPSLLTAEQIARILEAIECRFKVTEPLLDLCIESDPATVTDEKLEAIKQLGFTRISVGIQSFDDTVLKASNRSHTADGAREAIKKI